MKVLIVARNGMADRLRTLVEQCGAQADVFPAWSRELERHLDSACPGLAIIDPDLERDPRSSWSDAADFAFQCPIAYLPPKAPGLRRRLEANAPIGFLPEPFDRGDIASLLAEARAEAGPEVGVPERPTRSWPAVPELVAGVCALTAGAIAVQLPGAVQWEDDTQVRLYYLVAGLSLAAAGLLINSRRPIVGGVQAAAVLILTLLPVEI